MLLRILILLLPLGAFSKNQFLFDRFTIREGLSQNTVHCILKDSEGYYWFGTQDGLNKYDGYSVKIFRQDRNDSSTISDNFILCLIEDSHGNIWTGTRNGLNFLDKKTGRFTRIVVSEKEKSYRHNNIWHIFTDRKGDLIFSNTFGELVKISAADCAQPPFSPEIIRQDVHLIRVSDSSYCLLGNRDSSIVCFSQEHKEKWMSKNIFGLIYSSRILELPGGINLFGGPEGLYAEQNGKPAYPLIQGAGVNALFTGSRGNLWAGTNKGLRIYKGSDLSATPALLLHSPSDARSLGSSNVQAIYEDGDGLVWVGTSEAGVSVYDPQRDLFRIFNARTGVALSGNTVWAIFQDGCELWIGTNNGVNHLIFENGNLSGVYSGKNKLLSSKTYKRTAGFPNSICGNLITAIAKDKDGNMWFGTHDDGISVLHPATGKWKHFNTSNSPFRSNQIFHLFCDPDGKMWISTFTGFYYYDVSPGIFRSFIPEMEKGIFPATYIIRISGDRNGEIWVCSTMGVFHLSKNGDPLGVYAGREENPKGLSYAMVTGMLHDSKKRHWFTTLGGGLNLFDPVKRSFRAYTQKEGLSNDILYMILEDRKGNLWLSSNDGISCFNPETLSITHYKEKDGLPAKEFCQNAGFMNHAGEFLFGTPEGMVVFDPAEMKVNRKEIPILLSTLSVNYEPRAFTAGQTLQLFHDDKTVSFEFTAPCFRNQEKIKYAFMLEGFDNTWHETPASNRIASYTNLPFGNYVFKVRVKTGNASWQEKPLAVNVSVIPPFWLTPRFIALEIILALSLIILSVKYYAQRQLKKKLRAAEVQQKIHLERERISRDLHDNVGSHLTYITTSLDHISYKVTKETKSISPEKINELSDFTRSTMQQLRETIWAINKEAITVTELREKIREYGYRMTSAGRILFQTEYSGNTDIMLNPSQAIHIYRIVQEAVNNAIKHSGGDLVSVKISAGGTWKLHIEIADSGKGMENHSRPGMGLKNIRERIRDMKGELQIESNPGQGTKVKIFVPVQ